MYFKDRLKGLMRDLDLTQAQLSKLTGIAPSGISQYLSGKNEPSKERQRKIAVTLGVQENYFEEMLPITKPNNNPINLPVKDAARLLGKSKEWVMQGLRDGVFPWGYAVKLGKWSYFISSVKFTEYTGIEIPIKTA